ncbi:uncharacterized protein TNCV_3415111 [Trichonephila clavipes]|nr:uncharacterized protein TNCV_3415111 [Trichonephila clavipes]
MTLQCKSSFEKSVNPETVRNVLRKHKHLDRVPQRKTYISKANLQARFSFAKMYFTCRNCGGGDRGRVAIYRPFGEVYLSLNRTVTCIVLKANDRRTSCPCHDEFHGPRSDYVRQVALATTTTTLIRL